MISGATYTNGVALDADGRVYITPAPDTGIPATANPIKGKSPTVFGKVVDDQGRIYVRFV